MTFTTNVDGSITISTIIPAVTFLATGDVAGNTTNAFSSISPVPTSSSGLPIPTLLGTVYHPVWLLHVQIGTDTNNTIGEYKNTLSYKLISSTNHIGNNFNQTLSLGDAPISVTIPFKSLINFNTIGGLYALAYIGIGYRTAAGRTGTWWGEYDYGSNASAYQSVPPTAPGPINITLTPDNTTYNFSWSHAIPGTAPIAGYVLSWGTSPTGPFPNSITLPISAAPPSRTPYYTYSAPANSFGYNTYFIVHALDDGSSSYSTSNVPAVKVNYTPSGLVI